MKDPIALNLIKRLADDLESCISCPGKISDYPEEEQLSIALLNEAETYLSAVPGAFSPSDEDLSKALEEYLFWEAERIASEIPESIKKIFIGYARMCLARWGRSLTS